ncbi:hypothetical protein ABXN37_08395 [Piscinibacter sakaiensis]|uniref:Capsular polysaccharide export system inner membrane protein KpsE n=2 Tax=Piscinibacter sakaiensis TaxID=1547922 RepID=A0A0K8NXQ1_PISS1|nr:capsular polysaccharide export system inner membrane protein KpsE [Piscinibacter sakaiensis]
MLVPESELGGKVGKFTGPLPKGAPAKPPGVVWADVVPKQARILFDGVFLLCVVVPTLLAIAYYGFTASDVYTSEARFVVRTPQRSQPTTAIGALLQGSGFSRAQDDSFTVHDYITSRDALKVLDAKLGVRKSYADPSHDFLSRFPQPWSDDSFESFYKFYQDKVSVTYDAASSITTVRVRSFDPDISLKINEELLAMGEELVNRINDRGREDLVRYAAAEVEEAETKAKAAALALANYRNRRAVFDPERQSALQLQQITKLQDEVIAAKLQLAQLRALSPANPQIPTLERRVKGLEGEMASEMSKVAGGGNSFTDKATEFERLQLERGFADRQVASAMTSLENARNEARRKQIYLERIVQPHRPDEALEPRRARAILAAFVVGLVAWAVMSMLLAGVREHKD